MFNPIDILDKDLYYKTPLFGKMLEGYINTYGKDCIFYVNPNHESDENDSIRNVNGNTEIIADDVNRSHQRLDNYTLAYGKDMVGYDFGKLQQVKSKVLAEYKDYYVHDVGAEDSISFMIQVRGTPVSRGDIVSYKIQDKEIFYRISDKVQSWQEIIYRIQCKLIQVKQLGGKIRPYDLHQHKPDYYVLHNDGKVRPNDNVLENSRIIL